MANKMNPPQPRHSVNLTEDEIKGLIVVIGEIKIKDVHACRVRQVYDGLQELKDVQAELRIQGESSGN